MGRFVQENQLVYFPGRISPSPFTDEYPYPLFLPFLAPQRLGAMQKSLCFQLKRRFHTPKSQ
jgi:hypothetical protein